ncbi:hypothetical protein J5690_01745 [bacterium]|nr:hypothetical protein [bacterium]
MTKGTHAEVGSKELLQLQSELISLSTALKDCYEFVENNIKALNEEWRDAKFDEFEDSFRSRKDQIMELSEKYYNWATQYLQQRIEDVLEIENSKTSM